MPANKFTSAHHVVRLAADLLYTLRSSPRLPLPTTLAAPGDANAPSQNSAAAAASTAAAAAAAAGRQHSHAGHTEALPMLLLHEVLELMERHIARQPQRHLPPVLALYLHSP